MNIRWRTQETHTDFVGGVYFKHVTSSDNLLHTSSLLLFIISGKARSQITRQLEEGAGTGG
jgi:hypothetical protein